MGAWYSKALLAESEPVENPAMVQMATSGLVRSHVFVDSEVLNKILLPL
jgi:hypothetical protein